MSRRRGRAGSRRDNNAIYLGVFFLFLVLAIAGGAVYFAISAQRGGLDDRLCPEGGAVSHTILLVDKTDPMTFTQKEAINQLLSELGARHSMGSGQSESEGIGIKTGELFSIFVLGEDYRDTPKPVFEKCKPGVGGDSGVWLANPVKLENRYQAEFDIPLQSIREKLTTEVPAKWSPIMEMLQMVSINGFRRNETKGRKRLIIVSDMLHNTTEFSHFKNNISFSQFKEEPYFQKVRTDLPGVEVNLLYLMYSPNLQTKRNASFWEDFFREQNATVTSVKPCC